MKIKNLFVNGKKAKLAKSTLDDDVAGSLLPPVTPEDVGKVVSVNENGDYYLSEAGGGSAPLVVTFSGTSAGDDAACDTTFAAILEAQSAGREIKAKYVNEADETCVNLSVCWTHGLVQFAYSCFWGNNGEGTPVPVPVTLIYCEYGPSEEVQIETYFD